MEVYSHFVVYGPLTEVRNALTSTPLDVEVPGIDRDSGAGRILFQRAASPPLNRGEVPLKYEGASPRMSAGFTLKYQRRTRTKPK
jgi:hypothetical protein